jgi:hypothetical protein
MAKSKKSQANAFVIPVDTIKLLLLLVLTIVLVASLYVLFTSEQSPVESQLTPEPVTKIEGAN